MKLISQISIVLSMLSTNQILYEDNHLLVVNKPADVVTQGANPDQLSLGHLAKQYIKTKHNKPGNVYLGIVSRLDKLTTGVIVLARTSKAAARLTQAFQKRDVKKTYQALIEKTNIPNQKTLTDFVRKNDPSRKMEICNKNASDAQNAVLHFQLQEHYESVSLLKINLETGRKHQIRLQLSHFGCPILGDRKYGSAIKFTKGIALHSASLAFTHPTTKEELTFHAPIPSEWNTWMI